jgi:hypothetical protein
LLPSCLLGSGMELSWVGHVIPRGDITPQQLPRAEALQGLTDLQGLAGLAAGLAGDTPSRGQCQEST